MAYGLRYKAEYTSNGRAIKIEVLKKDYVGAVYDVEGVTGKLSLQYKNKDSAINGSEFSFRLITKNNAEYAELLTAEIGDYIGKYYLDGVLNHTGELDVENIETKYIDYVFEYDLGFNDRLAKLEKFTILDEVGEEIEGDNTLLWYIKQALIPTNLELDFSVILNTKEDSLMTGTNDNALVNCVINAERFKRVQDGKKDIYNCKEVIEAILDPFNLKLFQSKNKFFIVNQLEVSSFQYNYLYTDLSLVSKTAVSNTIDISTFKFERSNRLTKLSALKKSDVIFKNKTIQANLVRNPDFSNANLYWFKDEPGINVAINNGELAVSSDTDGKRIYSEDFAIEKVSDKDIIKLSFEYYLFSVNHINANGNRDPELEVSILYQGGNKVSYITPLNTGKNVFEGTYNNQGTGNYTIEIRDITHVTSPYSSIQYRMDNFKLNAITQEDTTTYDRFFQVTNLDNNAIEKDSENNILIADGIQVNDVGNLKINDTLTTSWSTFQGAEGRPLVYLYLLNKLRRRQKPNNDLKLTIIDNDNVDLNYSSSILFDGKRYIINEYDYVFDSVQNLIKLELIEVNYSSFNYTIENTTLTSVGGESTSNTASNFTETDPTVPNFVKSITQTNIDSWNAKVDRWEKWTNKLTVKNDLEIEATGSTSLTARINNNGIFEGENFLFNGVNGSGGGGSGGSAAIWGLISGTLSDQTDLQNALNGKENAFSKNTAFNKNFGTASGTVAQGNDSRIINGQTAFGWGNHANEGYLTSVPNLAASKITSGTFSDARISSSSVTQHLGNYVDRSTNQSINGDKTFTGILDFNFKSNSWYNDSNGNLRLYFGVDVNSNSFIFRAGNTGQYTSFRNSTNSIVSRIEHDTGKMLLGGSISPDERLHVLGNIKLSGAIVSDQSQISFLNNGAALPINTNNLLVSNSYSNRSLVPTNGMYVKGDILSGGVVTATNFVFG
jgi:hypothetical protein